MKSLAGPLQQFRMLLQETRLCLGFGRPLDAELHFVWVCSQSIDTTGTGFLDVHTG